MTTVAQTLADAISVLEPEPLDENQDDWYVPGGSILPSGRREHPLALLRAKLLRARDSERLFLSGHIGSGKSTELRRLLRDSEVLRRFFVVDFTLRATELTNISSHQLLFIMAAEIYDRAHKAGALSRKGKDWEKILRRIDTRLFGATGILPKEGEVEVEFNVFFVKLRTQLALEQGRRAEFRHFAETDGTVLVELINALTDDIATTLATKGLPWDPLIVIDDSDKVRAPEMIRELFETNVAALMAPRVPVLMTIPASVTFGGSAEELGKRIVHLRPVQVLSKTSALDPMKAVEKDALAYMHKVLAARVASGLFDPAVVDQAAVYSGGVLREFFGLLRDAAIRANDLYGLASVDVSTFYDNLVEARNALSRDLYPKEREALKAIRATHGLADAQQADLMNTSLVLEYNHDGVWWEANPLLWAVL